MDQFACLEVHVRNEDVVKFLLESLLLLYKHLKTTLKMMPIKELIMMFMITYLKHDMSKRKKKELQGNDAAMILRQGKGQSILA